MKRIIAIIFLLLCSSLIFAQDVKLEYRMPINTKIGFKERIQTHITTIFCGEKMSEVNSLLELSIKEDVIEANDKTFKSKQSVTMTKCETDGEDTLKDLDPKLVDNTIIYEMYKNGQVIFLGDKDGKLQEDFKEDKEEYLFPDKNVKIGDSWKCKKTVDGKKLAMTFTLEKLYNQDGVDIAKIKITVDDKIVEKDPETGESIDIFAKGGGYYYFAVNFGNDLYMAYNIDFKTKIDTKIEDNPVSLEITDEYKYQYWRSE